MNNFITLYLTTLLFIIFFWGKPQNIVSLSILLKSPEGWKTEKEPAHSRKETGQREVCNVRTSASLMSAAIFSSSFYVPPVHQLLPLCLPQVNLTPPLLVSELAPFGCLLQVTILAFPSWDAQMEVTVMVTMVNKPATHLPWVCQKASGALLEMGDLILLSPGL